MSAGTGREVTVVESVRVLTAIIASLACVAASVALSLFLQGGIDARMLTHALEGCLLAGGAAWFYAGLDAFTSGPESPG